MLLTNSKVIMEKILRLFVLILNFRFCVGAILSVVSFLAVDRLTGGIITSTASTEAPIEMAVFPNCPRLPAESEITFRTRLNLAPNGGVQIRFNLFRPGAQSREEIRKSLKACDGVLLRFNFVPVDFRFAPHLEPIQLPMQKCRIEETCVELSGENFINSHGSLFIATGVSDRYESFSTRELRFGIMGGRPFVQPDIDLTLPTGFIPDTSLPNPDYIESARSTKLYWRGSPDFGSLAPNLDIRSTTGKDIGILQRVGAHIRYSSPNLKRIETSMLILFSTLFGIGAGLVIESFIQNRQGTQK